MAVLELKGISEEDQSLPVLIVGAGPVGLVLAFLLTKLGVKCAVLEKSKEFSKHPQAHIINNRSMEVFRKLDGLAEEIARLQAPVDYWGKFVYCKSLTGSLLGSVDHMRLQDFDQMDSPEFISNFSQYKLTSLLVDKLEGLGFHIKHLEGSQEPDDGPVREKEILMGHECISVDASNHGVTVTALFEREGMPLVKDIHCKFLVGADGTRSSVRKLVGINLKGERKLQYFVSAHFFSHDLGHYLRTERPGMLFLVFNSEAVAFFIAHDLRQGEFVIQFPYFPPQQKLEDFNSEVCQRLIVKLAGRELADINVVAIKSWVMDAKISEKFLACSNRVILAGDAAHELPAAGGFGLNTGVQDAHNLAWKLAYVLHGIAPVSFLSTYEMERKQIANSNTELSVQNFKAVSSIPAALGLDPTIGHAVHQALNGALGFMLPSGLKRAIFNGLIRLGLMQLSDFFLNEKNPIGSARLAKLKQILEAGDSVRLLFPAEDIGFRYLEGALLSDGNDTSDALKTPPDYRKRDYVPSTVPGSRLPHMNIRPLSTLSSKETISTLDLVSVETAEFLLIIAPVEKSYQLARAAFKAAESMKVPLKVTVMWAENTSGDDDDAGIGRSERALNPWKNFVEVVEVKRYPTSPSWWDLCQMSEGGAILVRPDEHVAWRTKSGDDDANDHHLGLRFKHVFETILGLHNSKGDSFEA